MVSKITLLCFAITCDVLISMGTVQGVFNHSVGPLAVCSPDMEDARAYTENCYRRCSRNKEPSTHGYVWLYSDTAPKGGPVVTRCNKVRVKQVFTETWSFSFIKGTPTRMTLDVTEAECAAAMRSQCPTHNCNIKAPSELPEEYHYASDTEVVQDYLEILSMPSGLDYMEENLRITPSQSKFSFQLTDGKGQEGQYIYFWDTKYDDTKCPFDSFQSHGCDKYDSPLDLINCRESRFVIPSIANSTTLVGACQGLQKSTTGLIYKWDDRPDSIANDSKRIALTKNDQTAGNVATLRVLVADSLNAMDEDLCHTQCEMLDFILRSDRKREVLTRIGGSYLVVSKTSYIRKCRPLVGCRIVKPHYFCGNPNRVAIICHGKVWYWDPLKSYVDEGMNCERRIAGTKLVFSVGNHEYAIDDGMHVELPEHDTYGISHDLLASSEDRISKDIVDPTELRNSWQSHIAKEGRMSIEPLSQDKQVSHWDAEFSNPLTWLTSAGGWILDMSHKVTLWATVFLTLGALVAGAKVWEIMRKANRNSQYKRTNTEPNDSQATWI
nr:glycoprotein [Lettuce necrotic yellows virus]